MVDISYIVRQYVGNPGLFLDYIATRMEWGDLKGDLVFDIGCGNPKIKLADLLVERYPKLLRVYAIDNQFYLIRYIRLKIKHPLISHRCIDIENRSDLSRFEGIVDKVLSSHCFHMVKEQAVAFGNVFFMLRPGGDAAFLFCLSSGYADWFTDITHDVKWNKYFNGNTPVIPVTQSMSSKDDEYYVRVLENEGFEVIYCEMNKIRLPYPSDQQCRDGLLKLIHPSFSVPTELMDEFCSQLFHSFLKYNERDEQGRPCQISCYLTAMVKKPME